MDRLSSYEVDRRKLTAHGFVWLPILQDVALSSFTLALDYVKPIARSVLSKRGSDGGDRALDSEADEDSTGSRDDENGQRRSADRGFRKGRKKRLFKTINVPKVTERALMSIAMGATPDIITPLMSRLGVEPPVTRAIMLAGLQWYDAMPAQVLLLEMYQHGLKAAADAFGFPQWVLDHVVPAYISTALMFFLHEATPALHPVYRMYIVRSCGYSRPVLNMSHVQAAEAHSQVPDRMPLPLTTAGSITVPRRWARHFLPVFAFNFELFMLEYGLSAVLRGQLPHANLPIEAARSSLWTSLTETLGFVAGTVDIPDRPYSTTAVRLSMGCVGSVLTWIDSRKRRQRIIDYIGSHIAFGMVELATAPLTGWYDTYGNAVGIGRGLVIAWPALQALGRAPSGMISRAFLHTLGAVSGTRGGAAA